MKNNKKNPLLVAILSLAGLTFSMSSSFAVGGPFYWDNDGTTAGFGTAAGTWAAPTIGSASLGWSTSATGVLLPGTITTDNTDSLNFGNLTTGLAAGTVTVSGTVAAGNLTFASGSGAIVLSGGTAINLAAASTITLNNAADTISTPLTGAATSLTKAGTGILTLSGTNTYAGVTNISGGTLKIGNAAALGTQTGTTDGTTIASGATLDLGGIGSGTSNQSGSVGAERITASGAGVGGAGAILSSAAIPTNFIGVRHLTLAGNTTLGFTNRWDVGSNNSALPSSLVGGGFTLNVTGSGNGQASFNFLGETDLGDINVNLGATVATNIMFLQGSTTLGRPANTVTITGGSVLEIFSNNTNTTFDKKFALNNGILNVGRAATLPGTISLTTATNTINANTATTASGVISGTGSLIKGGANTLTLTGASTFTGVINVTAGKLAFSGNANVASANPLGQSSSAAANLLLGNGTTLSYVGAAASSDRVFTINGTAAAHAATLEAVGTGPINFTNTAALAYGTAAQTRTLTLTGTTTGANNLAASIGNNTTGIVTLSKTGAGTWGLSGNNTNTGTTALSAGVLVLNSANALPSGGLTFTNGAVLGLGFGDFTRLSGAAGAAGTFFFSSDGGFAAYGADRNVNIGGASGNVGIGSSANTLVANLNGKKLVLGAADATHKITWLNGMDVGGASRDLEVRNGLAAVDAEIRGVIRESPGALVGLNKSGTGTVAFSGANTFTGIMNLAAGGLQLDYSTQNNSKLSDVSSFILGGAVDLKGGTHTEVVSFTTIPANVAASVTRSSGTSVLQMGTITRGSGSSIDFGADNIASTTNTNTNGILGLWATVGGISFATNSTNAANGLIIAYTHAGSENVPRLTPGTIVNAPTSNVRLVEGSGSAGNILLGSAITTINTLSQSVSGGTSAATIDPAGQTLRTDAILVGTGAGALTIGSGSNNGILSTATAGGSLTVINNSVNNTTILSSLADNTSATSLIKSGSGPLILAGANTYTGSTTITTGTLTINEGSIASSSSIVNNAALIYNLNTNARTYANVISGSGTLSKSGTNTLTLTGVNTFTGAIAVTGGILDISGAGSLGSGTYAGAIAIDTGSSLRFSSSVAAASQTLSGAITGLGGLTMASSVNNANLSLTNTGNLYFGTTAISGGRIAAGPTTLSPNSAIAITGNGTSGGQLFINATGTVNNNFSLAGVGFADAFGSAGAIRFNNNNILTGTLTLTGDARVGILVTTASNTIQGKITGANGMDFYHGPNANSQVATFTLSNTGTANDYAGNTSLTTVDYAAAPTSYTGTQNILRLGASNQIPNGSGKGNLVLNGTDANHLTIFELNGFSETINGLSNVAAAGAIIRNNTAGASVLTIGDANTTSNFSGAITNTTGTLALTKIGTGTLTLSSGASNFSGNILVSDGTLAADATSTSGTTSAFGQAVNTRTITVSGGKNLRFDIGNVLSGTFSSTAVPTILVNSGATVTNNFGNNNALGNVTLTAATLTSTDGSATYGSFGLNGTVTSTGASLISTTAPVNGRMMLSGATTPITTFDVQSDTLTISAPLSEFTREAKISGLAKNGIGTLVLTGANTYSGGTTVNQGILTVGTGGTLGASISPLTVSNTNTGVGTAAILNLATAVDTTVGSLNGTIAIPSGGINTATINNGGVGLNFTVNQTAAGSFDGVIAGAGNFTLGNLSTNTLTLAGPQTYTGSTTVNGGTLKLAYSAGTSKLSDTASLTLGGGTVELSDGGTPHTEAVLSTSLTAGTASRVTRTLGTSVLQMNTITPGAGATIDFAANNIATTDNLNNAGGILGTWATVGGTDFATNATNTTDGLIIAYTGYADVPRTNSASQVIADSAASNVRIIEGTGSAMSITLGAATTTINTLNQSISGGTSAATIDPAGQTLRVNTVLSSAGAGALTIGTGTLSTATAGGDLALINSSGNDFTVNSVIANNTSASSLSKTGSGTLILGAANTYTGATVVGAGTLNLTGSISGSPIALNGSSNLNVSTGSIGGASSLTLASTGTSTLSSANTYTGGTTLSAGNLIIGNASALGTGPFTLSGGNFNTDGVVTTLANNNAQNWNANFTFGGASDLNLGTGAVTLGTNAQVTVSGVSTLTVGGVIGGAFGITKSGAGLLVLSANNAFSGGVTLGAGTLVLGNAGALGTGPLTINGGGLNTIDSFVANLVNANNNPQNWQASFTFTGTENLDLGTGAVTMLGNRTVTVDNNTLKIGGAIGGAYNLTKSGLGEMILYGVNSFTGSTTISAGTLTINGAGSLGGGNYAGAISNLGAFTYASSAAQTLSGVISGSGGTLTKSGTSTLTLTGVNTYTGATTISGGILAIGNGAISGSFAGDILNNAALVVNNNTAASLAGFISGTGTLTKDGTGTLTVSNVSSDYSGGTLIKNGIMNATGSLGTGTITLGGAGSTGATYLTGLGNANVFAINTPDSGTNTIGTTGNASVLLSGAIPMNGNLTVQTSAAGTASNLAELGGGITGTGDLLLNNRGTASLMLLSTTAVNPIGSITLQGASTGTTTISADIGSNVTTVTQNSASSALFLGGTNTYTGLTTVNAGAIVVQSADALGGTAVGTVVASGARLSVDGYTITGEAITISGTGGNFFGALQGRSGTSVWAGGVTIAEDVARIGAAAGASLEVSGVIDDGVNDYRVMFRPENSTATVIVSGSNTYTGGTSIVGGPVVATSLNKVVGGTASSNFGAPVTAANGVIIIGTTTVGGTLSYSGAGETTDRTVQIGANATTPVVGDTGGAGIENNGATDALIFNAPFFNTPTNALAGTSPTRTLTLGGSNTAANTISGIIQNNQIAGAPTAAVSVAKTGAGIWTLTGANVYTGNTDVTNGTLQINGSYAVTGIGTTSQLRIGNAASTNGAVIIGSGAGTVTFGGDGYANAAQVGINGGTGALTINGGTVNLAGTTGTASASLHIGVQVATTGGTGTVTVNAGTLNVGQRILMGANNVVSVGTLTIAGGTTNVGTNGTLGYTGNNPGMIQFGAGTSTLNLDGGTLKIFGFKSSTGLATINFNGGTLVALGSPTLFMGNNGGADAGPTALGTYTTNVKAGGAKIDTNNFNITIPSILVEDVVSTGGGLTKQGAGTLTLSAVNTYLGNTAVSAGTLTVTGSIASPASVAATGTLAGSGTVTGAATVAGTVSPGVNNVGTLNFGSTLTLDAASNYAATITGAATNDKVNVTGALAANGNIVVTLSGYVPVAGNTFDIADAGSFAGTPIFDFTGATLTAGLLWDTSSFATDGTIKVISADPFGPWATLNGVVGGKGGDDDGDGVSNLLEFATNSDPKSGASGARVYAKMHTLGGDNALTYTVATRKTASFAAVGLKQRATKDNVQYTVEASNDLTTWASVEVTELGAVDAAAVRAAIVPALPTLGTDWEWHTFRTDGGSAIDPQDFIRLQVEATP